MLQAKVIKLEYESIDSSIEGVVVEQPFLYGALKSDQAPVILFRVGAIELPGVTADTSNSRSIEFPSTDYFYAGIPMPDFATIGHVRIRISEVSRLEPPTIDF